MDQYRLDITGTDKHLWRGDKRLGRLNNVAEDTAQQIVQSLNAWEEIKQAATQQGVFPIKVAQDIVDAVFKHVENVPSGESSAFRLGEIPSNQGQSGEKGVIRELYCKHCGESVLHPCREV